MGYRAVAPVMLLDQNAQPAVAKKVASERSAPLLKGKCLFGSLVGTYVK